MGCEFVPRKRREGEDRIILMSLPDKEKPELPSTFVQVGYYSTPWAVLIIIKRAAPHLHLEPPSMSPTHQYIMTG